MKQIERTRTHEDVHIKIKAAWYSFEILIVSYFIEFSCDTETVLTPCTLAIAIEIQTQTNYIHVVSCLCRANVL